MLGVAKFKGASSQNPSNRKLKPGGKPYSSSRDREINWLRRIRHRPKGAFQTLTKTSPGFRRADRQGKFVPERRCTKAENSIVPVLVLHLGADKRGPLLKRRFLLGAARRIRLINKIGWYCENMITFETFRTKYLIWLSYNTSIIPCYNFSSLGPSV